MTTTTQTNPYLSADNSPELLNSVVAFVDILGYAELVRNPEPDAATVLNNLHAALTRARRHVDPERILGELPLLSNVYHHAFRAFTDNIVIGFPIHEDGEWEMGSVFRYLEYFQLSMVMDGFFVRGAISIGPLYMDDITVFGEGLIDAYEGESSLARDPRIILTDSARQAVDTHLEYYDRRPHAPQNYDLIRDTDGQWFLNYLDTLIPDTGVFFEEELRRHQQQIILKLERHRATPAVWSKYYWAARYHNYWCNRERDIPMDCRINLEEYAPEMRALI